MKYEAVIFDFDYTLADATEAIVECFNYAFTMINMQECEPYTIKKTIGMSIPNAFIQLTEINDGNLISEFQTHFKNKADEIMASRTMLFDDTIPILKYLKDNNFITGIVTNKFRYRIEDVLRQNNITELIDIIIGYEDVTNYKPHPDALNHVADKLNLSKSNILYIGDSIVDAEAAQRAEMDFIAVTTGTTEVEEFYKFSYKDIINNLYELKNIITPQNVFDDDTFFVEYKKLRENPYSANNVEEKPAIFSLLPNLNGMDILDLGCGYGENCFKFHEMGARNIVGIDIADKMLAISNSEHKTDNIEYINMAIEDIALLDRRFDLVISSLAIHYVKDFNKLVRDVHSVLNENGMFIFSQEHPLTTAPKVFLGWNKDKDDFYYKLTDYNISGERTTSWIIDGIIKYHRKFADIVNGLVKNGFKIVEMIEPVVSNEIIQIEPSYIKNHHKPNMLVIKVVKDLC